MNVSAVIVKLVALLAMAASTNAASIRNNGTVQTLIESVVDVTFPVESTTSTARRVWISYERGQLRSVLSTMDISRIISTHMIPIYDFPSTSSVVTMATDDEIAALLANTTIGPINVTDDPIRYSMVHSTKKNRQGQRHLQDGQTIPYGIGLTQVDQVWQAAGLTGEGVTVCVVDSGLDVTNPDLDTSGYTGVWLVSGSSWNTDTTGTGTHVTGIIAASNNGMGIVGAAPGAKIHTIDAVGENGFAYASALVDAALNCRVAGAKIISISVGGPTFSAQEDTLFTELFNVNGILSIAAAGNIGDSEYIFPASYDNVLSVGAVDESKFLTSFSAFNDRVDLVAPGLDVYSTMPTGGVCEICLQTSQWTYGFVSGTSQAASYVSGIAALLWSSNINYSVSTVYNALLNSAEDLGSTGRDVFYGNGLVSAMAAYTVLMSLSGTALPATAPPTPPVSSSIPDPPAVSPVADRSVEAPTNTSTASTSGQEVGSSILIIGISVGCVGGFFLAALVAFLILILQRQKSASNETSKSATSGDQHAASNFDDTFTPPGASDISTIASLIRPSATNPPLLYPILATTSSNPYATEILEPQKIDALHSYPVNPLLHVKDQCRDVAFVATAQ